MYRSYHTFQKLKNELDKLLCKFLLHFLSTLVNVKRILLRNFHDSAPGNFSMLDLEDKNLIVKFLCASYFFIIF